MSDTPRWSGWTRLVLAAAVLAALVQARADSPASSSPKPYPLKKCVVDGKSLSKSGTTYAMAWQGREVKFCAETCAPKFEKHSAKYLKKLERSEKKAARAKVEQSHSPSPEELPGGVAFAGW